MLFVTVTGIVPKTWTSEVALAARARAFAKLAGTAPGCVKAGIYRRNGRHYLYSAWETLEMMHVFQRADVVARFVESLEPHGEVVATHDFVCRTLPDRRKMATLWGTAHHAAAA